MSCAFGSDLVVCAAVACASVILRVAFLRSLPFLRLRLSVERPELSFRASAKCRAPSPPILLSVQKHRFMSNEWPSKNTLVLLTAKVESGKNRVDLQGLRQISCALDSEPCSRTR